MKAKIRIVRPSSREQSPELLPERITQLRSQGFEVRYDDLPTDPTWLYTASSDVNRAAALAEALMEPDTSCVLSARGGYGASDLLPLLPWADLQQHKPKLLVGFSDVSALHAALWTRLAWTGLHAPMPATTLWNQDPGAADTSLLWQAIAAYGRDPRQTFTVPLSAINAPDMPIHGRLFGGCFSVLTGLLGTEYFPASLAGYIVFIEDTDEHPGRLMRALNQWLQAGVLQGAAALVIGHLRKLGDNIPDCAPFVLQELAKRSGIPSFHTPLFGHTNPNLPLAIGVPARIHGGSLAWRFDTSNAGVAAWS